MTSLGHTKACLATDLKKSSWLAIPVTDIPALLRSHCSYAVSMPGCLGTESLVCAQTKHVPMQPGGSSMIKGQVTGNLTVSKWVLCQWSCDHRLGGSIVSVSMSMMITCCDHTLKCKPTCGRR